MKKKMQDVVFPYDRYCSCEQSYFNFRLAKKHPDHFDLIRNKPYHQFDFTEELVRLLGNIGEDDQVPVAGPNIIPKHSIMPEATSYIYYRFNSCGFTGL